MSSVIPVLSVLKNSDEGLPTAQSLQIKIPETSGEDPKVVSETIPSFNQKAKLNSNRKTMFITRIQQLSLPRTTKQR